MSTIVSGMEVVDNRRSEMARFAIRTFLVVKRTFKTLKYRLTQDFLIMGSYSLENTILLYLLTTLFVQNATNIAKFVQVPKTIMIL